MEGINLELIKNIVIQDTKGHYEQIESVIIIRGAALCHVFACFVFFQQPLGLLVLAMNLGRESRSQSLLVCLVAERLRRACKLIEWEFGGRQALEHSVRKPLSRHSQAVYLRA